MAKRGKRDHSKELSDEWLDEESISSRGRSAIKKKRAVDKPEPLPPEQANGTVAEVFPNLCRVRTDDGRDPLCAYRRANVIGQAGIRDGQRERSPVAVGDRVKVQVYGAKDGLVEGVALRKNRLVRPAPDREEGWVHVIVSNIDALVVVVAAANPEFSPGIVDRFLIAATAEKIPCILCVNKIDLFPGETKPWDVYRQIGVEVHEVSAKRELNLELLRARLLDRKVAFCGHSGVGKTSLLRKLIGMEVGKVGEVNEATGKGKHTTTGAVLLDGPGASQWIDTPGVREFGLLDVTPETLAAYFPEISSLACATKGCLHLDEEDCRARELPRYPSYRRIYESLAAGEH